MHPKPMNCEKDLPSANSPQNDSYSANASHYVQFPQSSNLELWQWDFIKDYTDAGKQCMLDYWSSTEQEGLHCPGAWDCYNCWKTTPANTTVIRPCPIQLPGNGYRYCNSSGMWHSGTFSNYSECVDLSMLPPTIPTISDVPTTPGYETLRWDFHEAWILASIYFYGGIICFILLAITLFIFVYFRALHCNRISIHKHLVFSFIVRSVIDIVIYEPFVTGRYPGGVTYRDIPWLCKTLTSSQWYSVIANILWMFVEGLFLHNRVAVTVFHTEAPFRVFYLVGWGLPGYIVATWACCMHFFNPNKCWHNHFQMPYKWILAGPILIALVVNTIFLINIIRILVTKLRANNNTLENERVRKAVKATAVLFPLLGMTNLLFVMKPKGGASESVYRILNAVMQSSQGIFVSVIYCFMNSEVRIAVLKKWHRWKTQRFGAHHIPASHRELPTKSSTQNQHRYIMAPSTSNCLV